MMPRYACFASLSRWAAWGVLLVGLLLSAAAGAQTYTVPASGSTSITTCSGNLYDNGGPNNTYSTYADGSTTIYPGIAGNKVKLEFTSGATYYYDQLIIYDGESTSAPVIGVYTNTYSPAPGTVYGTSSSGALTVRFATSYYSYQGFAATISCVTSVPKPDLAIQSASVQPLSVVAGGNVSVSSAIYNLTGASAASSNVGYYLSTDGTLDNKDLLIGNSTGGALAAGNSSTRQSMVQIPASTATGTYYLLFVADYQNAVAESNEANNVASVAVSVVPSSVDLSMLQAVVSPTSTAVGNAISFSGYVQNKGNATAASSSVGYYLSSNATLDNADVLLTSSYGGSLAAGSSGYVSATTNIPGTVKAGSYYILFVADYQALVSESNEGNNVTAVSLTVVDPAIDLIVTQGALNTTTTTAGRAISGGAYVYNQGNTTATSSSLGYYLSTDTRLDGSDVLLNTSAGSALGASQSSYRSATLTIPAATAAGNYYVLMVADYNAQVSESNETNNLYTIALRVEEPYVDLNPSYSSTSASQVASGSSLTAYTYLYNRGNATSATSKLAYYLSTDNVLDTRDILVGSSSVPGISPGYYLYPYTTVQIPATTTAGTYYLLFSADYDNQIKESNEQNNVDAVAIQVIAPGIDLYITSFYLDKTTAVAGTTIGGTFYVNNGGNTTSVSSNAQVFLSKDATFDSQDDLLLTSAGGSLSAGYYTYRSLAATIPAATTAGSYYLLVVADATNLIAETNEQNNVSAQAITVTEPFNGTLVPASGAASITTCGTKIADNGGAENYQSYTNGTLTVYPSTTGAKVQLDFTQFSLNYYAYLTVYDGPDTSAPILFSYQYYNASPGTVKATNSTGALTVTFKNEYNYTGTGFEATVSCIGGSTLPDLTLSGATLPATSVTAGTSLAASVKITNAGSTSASASTAGFYLSTDDKFSTSDVVLATVSGSALAAGANATRSATLAIPAGTTPGSYFILFVADPAETVTESNEANNLTTLALSITGSLPNLELASGKLSATSVVAGNALNPSVTIKNTGNAAATASTVSYYLSRNTTLEASDISLGQTTGGALAAGGSATRSSAVTIPAGTAAGSYYVLLIADAQKAVTESDETDNLAALALTVTATVAQSVDLQLTTPTLSKASGPADASFSADVNVFNSGTAAAASSTVGFYLSTNTTLDAADVSLGQATGGTLAAAASAPRNITSLAIPASTVPGSYYVLMVADPDNLVTESNEANNTASAAFTVTGTVPTQLPDLTFVVSATSLSTSTVVAGGALQVNGTIFNAGTGAATSTPFTVFLSSDQTLGASDVKLGTTTGAILSSGQLTQQALTVTIPAATAAGNYYLLAMLNADNSLSESNLANNVISLPLQVSVATAQPEQTAGLTIGVYPNPASAGYFRVTLEGARPTTQAATLTLFNSLGQRLEQRQLPGRRGTITFDSRALSKGVYLLRITGDGLSVLRRVVIE